MSEFLVRALVAGTAIAAVCGPVGYLLVLRAQVFLGEALSHVAFTVALAALAAGVDLRLGLFAGTVAGGVGLGAASRGVTGDDVLIGTVLAWVIGLGVLFLSLYTTARSAGNGSAGVTVLFGSILGLDTDQAVTAVLVAGGVLAALLAVARPLLFATVDATVAAARGVPVRVLGIVFLALVGATAAEAAQAVGSLLLVGLLAAPGGAAHRLTTRPFVGMALAAGLAVLDVWVGLALASAAEGVPPAVAITAIAALTYLLAAAVGRRPVGGYGVSGRGSSELGVSAPRGARPTPPAPTARPARASRADG